MKRELLILLNIIIGCFMTYSQTGIWSGNLDVQGTKLPIVFHLDEKNPTLDSPAQAVKGIPTKITKSETDSITISIPAIGATFKGKYGKNEIKGIFSQGGLEFPLVLTPGEPVSRRPQTPQPPYPYTQEEVSFSNGDAVLKGTLTLPNGLSKDTPVLIMITGSGLQNRDEEIFDHKPFAVIADALARNGIATLRYDDRGFGESSGDAVNCTTEDLKNDAMAGIDLLRVKFNKVGVLGHSEGGTIAFMLGAEQKADFIISLAGMIISGKETLLLQNRHLLSQAGYPQEVTDEYCALLSAAFDNETEIKRNIEYSSLPLELKQNLITGLSQLNNPYMQYLLASDPQKDLGHVSCPVLALNGTKDTQVFYKENLDAIKNGLKSGQNNKILSFEGLNHLFQHCKTGSVNEYSMIEETISPEVLETIIQWIKSLP